MTVGTSPEISVEREPRHAWRMLVLGVGAQTAGTVFINTPAFLIPLLHADHGLTLAQAGLLASTPTLGLVVTLIAWGVLADRIGERWVIAGSLALTALASLCAILIVHGGSDETSNFVWLGVLLFLGGMASAGTNSASGKIVVGWFPKHRRGLAMGVRQMAVPLGVTVAAVTVPTAANSSGVGGALVVPLAITGVLAVACAIGIRNPPRVESARQALGDSPSSLPHAGNPYRSGAFLWRIHAVSILLVVPQFTLSTFALVWLVTDLRWDSLPAGVLVGASQFVGALGRIAVGFLSDRVGSRVHPLRWVAAAAVGVMLFLALAGALEWQVLAATMIVVATVVVVADNGLAFTSVAEAAGQAWTGRALGVQNTVQYIAASAVGPGVGALIGLFGFPLAFVAVALFPVVAIPLVPRADAEHDRL